MKNRIIVFAVLALITAVGFIAGIQANTYPYAAEPSVTKDSVIKRGKYLVEIMGCNDCHSPKIMTPQGPVPDPDRLLSGHPSSVPFPDFDKSYTRSFALFSLDATAIAGPWGISYAANLTSDKTGIGNWTEFQFGRALREGKFKGLEGTRPLLPPMPWQNFTKLRDEDLHAIFTYLKSTKPVKNVVPEPVINR